MARNNHRPMSIDAMLDMERQEVLALLESKSRGGTSPEGIRPSSPYAAASRSPVRSMLDIEEEGPSNTRTAPSTQAPVRSMLDVDGPVATTQPPVRSMLDLDSPSPPPSTTLRSSSPTSPGLTADPQFKSSVSQGSMYPRNISDTGFKPAEFGPRSGLRNDRTSEYQFSGILSRNSGQPKWSSQTNKRQPGGPMGEPLRGPDLSGLQLHAGDRGRHPSIGERLGGNQSKSPHSRWEARSRSPATFAGSLPTNKTNRAILGDGQIVDISSAYRRLSDANLAFSSGSLAQLPMRKRTDDVGEGRLIKDYLGPDGEHLESSEEDDPYTSDDEDRGRKIAPRALNPDARGHGEGSKSRSRSGQGERQSLSLLAAAEQERSQVASTRPAYQYRSLIPEAGIKTVKSSADTAKPSKGGIHPNTSYDQCPASGAPSVVDSDEDADVDDIKRAQQLSFSMTNILTSPESHRAVRVIYRGEYNKIAQQAEEEHHRLRKYLVATDLSDESTHALEWAIGTVLRDGDTLIAIYCVDEETGIATSDSALVPDDAKAMREQAAAIHSVTNSKTAPQVTPVTELKRTTALHLRNNSTGTSGSSPGPSARGDGSRADEERRRAIQDITDRVLRLLRKTRLQVRVIVEVLHCKNPRHLVTEVIDLVNPTLVVIGSRGRSALKGVILGSFSNYLVTKSSVPVMVARKRLRKQSKNRRTAVRQVNNLSNPVARSLANAKID
ncbi:Uncharacterized protein TCAP_02390 [Tolypocladium capitatum]|uniref:UspA domain-containing protein n=1 Tax=Tolypocladium capitatum TaxID=45235 RepID=A0A2K3QJG4_9HYPO|nr:Uncharacterized protein TCAP_02390 [Tolypocladium capitatum]